MQARARRLQVGFFETPSRMEISHLFAIPAVSSVEYVSCILMSARSSKADSVPEHNTFNEPKQRSIRRKTYGQEVLHRKSEMGLSTFIEELEQDDP